MRDALGDVQSVLVLGGRSEIALATVDALATRRLRSVVLAVRDIAAAQPDAERLRARGLAVDVVAFDAAHPETHAAFVDAVFGDGIEIDLVILAFGILGDQERADRDAAHAQEILNANFNGAVSVLVPLANRMADRGHGTIAVISSVAAMRARRANFVYAASKAGLDAFACGLADAHAKDGVHVMIVRPGFVTTRMTDGMKPAPFATTTDVVATAIIDGMKRRRRIVYAPNVLQFVMPILRSLPHVIWTRLGG